MIPDFRKIAFSKQTSTWSWKKAERNDVLASGRLSGNLDPALSRPSRYLGMADNRLPLGRRLIDTRLPRSLLYAMLSH